MHSHVRCATLCAALMQAKSCGYLLGLQGGRQLLVAPLAVVRAALEAAGAAGGAQQAPPSVLAQLAQQAAKTQQAEHVLLALSLGTEGGTAAHEPGTAEGKGGTPLSSAARGDTPDLALAEQQEQLQQPDHAQDSADSGVPPPVPAAAQQWILGRGTAGKSAAPANAPHQQAQAAQRSEPRKSRGRGRSRSRSAERRSRQRRDRSSSRRGRRSDRSSSRHGTHRKRSSSRHGTHRKRSSSRRGRGRSRSRSRGRSGRRSRSSSSESRSRVGQPRNRSSSSGLTAAEELHDARFWVSQGGVSLVRHPFQPRVMPGLLRLGAVQLPPLAKEVRMCLPCRTPCGSWSGLW